VLELAQGADVLIHDSQYTRSEFEEKSHWGHCTIDYAVTVASEAGARKLVMFHHDPSHGDDRMDELVAEAVELGRPHGVEVVAAFEGLRLGL
jgi:ribonuclease BN (tRNA processing enzyme)